MVLEDQCLNSLNLGDSGFWVLRRDQHAWAVVQKTSEQLHYFNCPLQLGTGSMDSPQHAEAYSHECVVGDIVVMATDGLFDNVFQEEVCYLLDDVLDSEKMASLMNSDLADKEKDFTLQVVVDSLGELALNASQDRERRTPFSQGAQDWGIAFSGGKVDDITIVLSVIVSSNDNLEKKLRMDY